VRSTRAIFRSASVRRTAAVGTEALEQQPMEVMARHRSHRAAFKRHVAEEFLAEETLHGLSQRHDISRQLIRIWVGNYEARNGL